MTYLIGKDGKITVEVNGVRGAPVGSWFVRPSKKLGVELSTELKPEYFEQTEEKEQEKEPLLIKSAGERGSEMASALWLGSMEPQQLTPFLSLPVQVMVTSQSVQPRLAGQRLSRSHREIGKPFFLRYRIEISISSGCRLVTVVLPRRHVRLLALGQVPPPTGSSIAFPSVLPQEQYAALCRLLPLAEPENPFTSMAVRCAVRCGGGLPPLLERLGSL